MLDCYTQNLFTILKYVFKKEQMTCIQHYKHTGIDKNGHKPRKLWSTDHCQGLLPATRTTMCFWDITFLSSFLEKTPPLVTQIQHCSMNVTIQTDRVKKREMHTHRDKDGERDMRAFFLLLGYAESKKETRTKTNDTFLSCNTLHCQCSNTTVSITVMAGAGRVHH